MVADRCLAKANPGGETADEPVLLGHLPQSVDDTTVEKPEIAGVDRHLEPCQAT
jgi:hypothetical protein